MAVDTQTDTVERPPSAFHPSGLAIAYALAEEAVHSQMPLVTVVLELVAAPAAETLAVEPVVVCEARQVALPEQVAQETGVEHSAY